MCNIKRSSLTIVVMLGIAAAVGWGCNRKVDVKTELEKTAEVLAQTETAQPAPAPVPEPSAQPVVPAALPEQPAEPAAAPAGTPSQQMRQALTAYKSGELEDAVTRLQKLRTMPTLTAQQRMVVQDSVAAVMTEVYGLAAKGNSRAIAAVKQYEEMQTSRH